MLIFWRVNCRAKLKKYFVMPPRFCTQNFWQSKAILIGFCKLLFPINVRDFKILFYFLRGSKPWTLGYTEYKFYIIKILCSHVFNLKLFCSKKITCFLDERVVEYPWVLSRLPKKPGRLLDAGSCLNFDLFINHNKLKNKKICIFNLAPDARCLQSLGVSYIWGDLRRLPFKKSSFDFVTCISTLEHIGMNNSFYTTKSNRKIVKMPFDFLKVIKNFRYILKKEGLCLLTFPFGKQRNLSWMRIFSADDVLQILNTFQPSLFTKTFFIYKNFSWQLCSESEAIFSGYYDFHSRIKWHKGLPAAAGAVCCLELKK